MKDHGFTLVELMIVVAIIGILASIAIPNFQKYQARARQREANIALGGVYTALKSYVAEVGTYTACLRQAGYAPENSNGNVQSSSAARYYLVGFSVGSITGTGLCGTGTPMTSCNAYQWDGAGAWITACTYTPAAAFGSAITASDIQYAANASARSGVTVGDANLAISFIDKNNFIAAAAGNISTSVNTVDLWSINEGKYLRNFTNGAN